MKKGFFKNISTLLWVVLCSLASFTLVAFLSFAVILGYNGYSSAPNHFFLSLILIPGGASFLLFLLSRKIARKFLVGYGKLQYNLSLLLMNMGLFALILLTTFLIFMSLYERGIILSR